MSDLNFNLPDQQEVPTPKSNLNIFGIVNTILLLVCIGYLIFGKQQNTSQQVSNIEVKTEKGITPFSEDLVIKLKKAGAFNEAAKLIDSALSNSSIDNTKRANLLKRKGDLLAQTKNKDQALVSYYYAEALNNNQDKKLSRKLTQSIIDILRNMGQYSSVSSEIARKNRMRSGINRKENDPVVATVDGERLTMSDFDVALQKFVDSEITRLTANIQDEEEIKKITNETRKQYSAPYEKLKYLQTYITQDVLYRDALKWELNKHPAYIENLEAFRKNLLRNLLIQENIKIDHIDDSDLKNFANVNRSALNLSTNPGSLSTEEFESVKPLATKLYKEQKTKERTEIFQKELFKRHQIEIKREPFTEGAK
jgi:hypothetical protein